MESNNGILVEVKGLSKKFCKDLKKSLWYGVKDLFSGIAGNKHTRDLRPDEFWAVKDISFTLKRGECLGLIGHNGAGKSTLLKILNGLINPDEGTVTMSGRVGALIELGAGFNPILSGRENIYNNGAVLGFSKKEIDDKIEEIIDFSEIREFIDMPVQNYSSGMKVRLGFAVAAQMEPDILIIDEVLAVGDLGFVLKCFKQIDTILPQTAIVFVSHNMPMVSRICNKVILMNRGESMSDDFDVSKGIDSYYSNFDYGEDDIIFDDKILELHKVKLLESIMINNTSQLKWGDKLLLYFEFNIKQFIPEFLLRIIFYDLEKRPVAIIEEIIKVEKQEDSILKFTIEHKEIQLSKGVYSIDISIFKNKSHPIYRHNNILDFSVNHKDDVWPPFLLKSTHSVN